MCHDDVDFGGCLMKYSVIPLGLGLTVDVPAAIASDRLYVKGFSVEDGRVEASGQSEISFESWGEP